ncbi:MAG TPA: hypothetical protein PLJ47_01850 [Candidatus Hydrogenedentes bacterium]|nr:hypothetical protein [Candidatus Hydrogenedentota bacterium]HRK33309.1 hypothetical protein [Candidatus Hydrogenedentota bacterium]
MLLDSQSEEVTISAGSSDQKSFRGLGVGLIVVAVTLRFIEYARNKAIWLDEAHLALSILRRGYTGLLDQLDYGQGAPLAFLWLERLAVDLAGPGEYALRFVPMLASVAACALLYPFLHRFLPRNAALFSFAVFVFSLPAIRYAAEVKAYATDLLVALLLFLLLIPAQRRPFTLRRATATALAGSLAVWCAFPSVFILAGVGAALILCAFRDGARAQAAMLIGVATAWATSFAVNYHFLLRHNAENAEVRTWWLDRFMPLPPTSLSDFVWFPRTFFEVFGDPVGIISSGVGAFLFLLGIYSLWHSNRLLLVCLLAPIGVALLASGLQRYPFMGRFLLFLVPLALVLIGAGWHFFTVQVRNRAIMVSLLIVVFAQPVIGAVRGVLRPAPQGVRPAFEHLAMHWREGDRLYVYHWAVAPFQYCEYKTGRDFPEVEGASSRADWKYYEAELQTFRGAPRVWVLMTNTPAQLTGEENKFFVNRLDNLGEKIDSQSFGESSLHLYNLQGNKLE